MNLKVTSTKGGCEVKVWQKCPKCDGQGIVSKPSYVPGDVYQWSSSATTFYAMFVAVKR